MNKKTIFDSVQDIFRDIFDKDTLIISYKTSSEDIEHWDSLNHILLINAVQEEFNIKISLEEMQLVNDVSTLLDVIKKKIY